MTRTTWVPTPHGETTATAYRETVEEAVGAYSQQEDGLFFELTGGIDSRLLLAARTPIRSSHAHVDSRTT